MRIDRDAIYCYRHATAEEKAQLLNTLSQGPSDAVVNDTTTLYVHATDIIDFDLGTGR